MKRFVRRRDLAMPIITMNKIEKHDYETQMQEFNDFLKNNMKFIKQIAPMNPTISRDDEWNDPIYDHYAQIDDVGDD